MNKYYASISILTVTAAIVAGTIYLIQSSDSEIVSAKISKDTVATGGMIDRQNGSPSSALNTQTKTLASNAGGLLASPFAIGSPVNGSNLGLPATTVSASATDSASQTPEKEVITPQEAARRQKMEQLGYMVPPDYYNKDLKTLQKMAKAGDAFAMVHIGEKYAFELNGQTNNPEFDSKIDYASAAKQSFKEALVAGNIRSAGIIAELYFQEKNSMQAYAWHLVSDQMGDSISADWFRSTDMAKNATPELKNAAATRAAQIISELKAMQKKTP